jgi:xanthine dehydrogenase molybdopterin-binding subunit B
MFHPLYTCTFFPQVLCVGQVICAVVAETDVQAKRAIEKIKITYEDLKPVIFTIEVSRGGQATPMGVEAYILL